MKGWEGGIPIYSRALKKLCTYVETSSHCLLQISPMSYGNVPVLVPLSAGTPQKKCALRRTQGNTGVMFFFMEGS